MIGFADNSSQFSENPMKSSPFSRSLTINSSANEYSRNAFCNQAIERSGSVKNSYNSCETVKGKVSSLRRFFESRKASKLLDESSISTHIPVAVEPGVLSKDDHLMRLPDDRVVVYFTSLRGIRRTYEDCYAVRMILRGFNVDERDISMDSVYKKELQAIMGSKSVVLPQVFIKGKYIGGAETIKHLNEVGELRKVLKGLSMREPGFVCYSCGDVRFIPCMNCSGSRKVFDEDDEQLKRCVECNENGLVRCSICCS